MNVTQTRPASEAGWRTPNSDPTVSILPGGAFCQMEWARHVLMYKSQDIVLDTRHKTQGSLETQSGDYSLLHNIFNEPVATFVRAAGALVATLAKRKVTRCRVVILNLKHPVGPPWQRWPKDRNSRLAKTSQPGSHLTRSIRKQE
jgi:hypothetical protein